MRDMLHRLIIGAASGVLAAHILAPLLPPWAQHDTLGTLVGAFALVRLLQALHLDQLTGSALLLSLSSAGLALWPTLLRSGTRQMHACAALLLGAAVGALVGWTWGLVAGPQWTQLGAIALVQRPLLAAVLGLGMGALLVHTLIALVRGLGLRHGPAFPVVLQAVLLTALAAVAASAQLPVVAVLPGALAWGEVLYLLVPPPDGWQRHLPGRAAAHGVAPRVARWWTRGLVCVALAVSAWLLVQPI